MRFARTASRRHFLTQRRPHANRSTFFARHAAAINSLVGRGFKGDGPLSGSIPTGAFAAGLSMDEVLAQVKPFLAS